MPIDIRILGEEYKDKPFTGHDLPMQFYFNKRRHDFSSTELKKRIAVDHLSLKKVGKK